MYNKILNEMRIFFHIHFLYRLPLFKIIVSKQISNIVKMCWQFKSMIL